MFDVIDMPWSWPVEVNHHEAKAFCVWHGEDYRLPVEAEHTVMRGTQVQHDLLWRRLLVSPQILTYETLGMQLQYQYRNVCTAYTSHTLSDRRVWVCAVFSIFAIKFSM